MSLFFSFPDIPASAIRIRSDQAFSHLRPYWNLFKGERSHYGQIQEATASNRVIKFTLSDGQFKSASSLIIARADLLLDQGVTNISLAYSSNDSSYTNVFSTSFTYSNLIGKRAQDLLINFTQTSAYQYWKFEITCPYAITKFSKLYFGNMFDLDTYPSSYNYSLVDPKKATFISDSGAMHTMQAGLTKHKFKIVWDGVTDTKCEEAFSLFNKNKSGLFIYAPQRTEILNDSLLMHVKCVNFYKEDTEGFPDWNKLTMEFEEMI